MAPEIQSQIIVDKIIKFPAKNSVEADLYLPQEWSKGVPNICHVLELKVRSFWRVKASKIIDCIAKCFEENLYKIKFPTRNSMSTCLYLPQQWNYWAPKICHFSNNALK